MDLAPGWLLRDVVRACNRVRQWRLAAMEFELAEMRRKSSNRIEHLETLIATERRALNKDTSHD